METIQYKNYEIKIHHSELHENPMDDYDKTKLVSFHRRYGTNHGFSNPKEVLSYAKKNGFVAYKVFILDHSGTAYSLTPFSCPWDSMFYGFLLIHREEFGFKKKQQKMYELAESILQTYEYWANGYVYGYVVENIDESCWGFYGSDHEKSGLMDYATNAIDCHITHETNKHLKQLKPQIKQGVSINHRKALNA